MNKILFSFILLIVIQVTSAQAPNSFRYQAAIHDKYNNPITDEIEFEVVIFNDKNATIEVYRERQTATPDMNGLVAFSIGEGTTDDNFSDIIWANGPYYIQIFLDNEELSYSQLVSVPYAMHANTADALYNLQEPTLSNDPTTKSYVDRNDSLTIDSLTKALKIAKAENKAYADSLSITPKDLDITASGDTLNIGNQKIVIAGLSSQNSEAYKEQRVLGGSYNEKIISTLMCKDSSYIIIANTQSSNGDINNFKGDADIWVVKISSSLDVEWKKTLGGNDYDNGVLVLEESDGFLIGTTTESSDNDVSDQNGEFDIWLVKIDTEGTILWEHSYGGSKTEFLNAILPKDDGGYYIGATTYSEDGDIKHNNGESDIWVFETDSKQEITQSQTFGGISYDALVSMSKKDNQLVLFGSSSSNDGDILSNNGGLDFTKIVLNLNLEVQDQDCYGTASNDRLSNVVSTTGNTILAGTTLADNWDPESSATYKNIYLKCLGNNDWDKQLGGEDNDIIVDMKIRNDTLTILAQTASQTGDVTDNNGEYDIWVIQLSLAGDILKSITYGGRYNDYPKALITLDNGNWLIGAESESYDGDVNNNNGEKDVWLLELDHSLNIVSSNTYGGTYDESIEDIFWNNNKVIIFGTTSSNDYSITGLHDKPGKSNDVWILKTEF